MSEKPALVEFRNVTFRYGADVVLDQVSLSIFSHDYLAVIGPNGGGKTTLVKLALGLLRPSSGEVLVRLPQQRGTLGYVPQSLTFDKHFPLRVVDVVLMGMLGRRGRLRPYTRADRADARDMLERLRLGNLHDLPISELSGGQLQRVLIARALVSDPAILFLDEPTASIDPESREILADLLEKLNQKVPIVLVTHDITGLSPLVQHFACVNRKLYYHGREELTAEVLEKAYGCPIELIGHGLPHRVLREHAGSRRET